MTNHKKNVIMIKPSKEGSFTRKAKAKNMSVQAYATLVIKQLKGKTNGSKVKLTLLRQATFAKNAKKHFNK
tara:strand:- start:2848 stop:3060 length:213 start_codon:yes stop_codon:yes gene_type:complete